MNIPYVFKKCTKCREWLVANNYNFGKDKRIKWGLKSQCKRCVKECQKEWYENNKEHCKKLQKEWRENNKEHCKQWRENNKEYEKERKKQWRENNKEHDKKVKKEWNKNNPEKAFNRRNKRRSKLENQGRGITNEQYIEYNKWFDWKCAYSGEKMKNNKSTYGRTLDHIVALDNGGLNEPWNIVPMRKGYNSSKQDRIDSMTWYLEQEYFDIERLNKIIEWQIYAYEKWGGEEFGELILITDLFKEE